MRRDDWAYFAGIFDGEGHIAFQHPPLRGIYLIMNHTDHPLVQYMHHHLGGRVYVEKVRPHRRTTYRWIVTRRQDVGEILTGIAPWSRVKQLELERALRLLGREIPSGAQFAAA